MSGRDRPEPDLTTLVEELRDTLDELQGTVERDHRGTPRPPRPRELLQFTESYTIPTLISLLEASIRALELLQATLRLVDGRPLETRRRAGTSDTARRVESVGRATVDRVDAALTELTAALEGEPPEGEARDLLADARALREEVDTRLRSGDVEDRSTARRREPTRRDRDRTDRHDRRRTGDAAHEIPVRAESDPTPESEDVDPPTTDSADEPPVVDVDAELESIRDEVEDERERSAAWRLDGSAGGETDGDSPSGEGAETDTGDESTGDDPTDDDRED